MADGAATSVHRRRPVEAAFSILALSAIFLQKIGFPVAGNYIGLNAFILWGVLLWLFIRGDAVIDLMRALFFAVLVLFVLLSLFIAQGIKSVPALIVFLAMYATMLFKVEVDQAIVARCLNVFQKGMCVVAVIVIVQQVLQYTVGNSYWPNLEHMLPSYLLAGDYAYIRPYAWRSPYLVPNGIFFLEPSVVSVFTALALAAEIVWFKRLWRLGLYACSLVVGVAGSGVTIIAICSIPLFLKMDRRLRAWTVGLGVPIFLLAVSLGAFTHFIERSSEFSNQNSSAYARITVPFEATLKLSSDPNYFAIGNGPGTSLKAINTVQWPFNKLTYEYGLVTAIAFHVFLTIAILGHPASRTVALIIFIPHIVFGGGFVTHTNIMMLILFGSLLQLTPKSRELPASYNRREPPRLLLSVGGLDQISGPGL